MSAPIQLVREVARYAVLEFPSARIDEVRTEVRLEFSRRGTDSTEGAVESVLRLYRSRLFRLRVAISEFRSVTQELKADEVRKWMRPPDFAEAVLGERTEEISFTRSELTETTLTRLFEQSVPDEDGVVARQAWVDLRDTSGAAKVHLGEAILAESRRADLREVLAAIQLGYPGVAATTFNADLSATDNQRALVLYVPVSLG